MTDDARRVPRDADQDEIAAFNLFQPKSDEMTCPPVEIVQAWSAGMLPPALESRTAAHLKECGVCRTLRAAMDDSATAEFTVADGDRIRERVRAAIAQDKASRLEAWGSRRLGAGRWALSRWVTVAASVGLSALFVILLWQQMRAPARSIPPIAEPPTTASVLEVQKPDLPTAIRRSERAELREALAPYRDDNFPQATEKLTTFVARHPDSALGHFYLGVSNLLLRREESAVPALETAGKLAAETDPSLAHQANWYLALAFKGSAQFDRARDRLGTLCSGRGELSARACLGLQQVPTTFQVSGTVKSADGQPLAGVTVGQYIPRVEPDHAVLSRTTFAGITDIAGAYTVSGMPVQRARNVILRASKWGYVTGQIVTPLMPQMSADFQLTPWTVTAFAEVVKGDCPATPDICRQFAFSAPRSGTLDASLSTLPSFLDLWIEMPTGEVHSPRSGGSPRVTVPVMAGTIYQVTVVNNSGGPAPFELTMRMK